MMEKTERDARFDTIKGIAILIVVVGHVIQHATQDHTHQTVYNFIWAIQMPLFMILSGYFSSNRVQSLPAFLYDKACRYLIPFCSFTLLHGLYMRWDVAAWKKVLWRVDYSLWYLYVLFVLSIMQYLASRAAARCATPRGGVLLATALFLLQIGVWAVIAVFFGLGFLGAKYILYYSLYFWAGRLWRKAMTDKSSVPFAGWLFEHQDGLYAVSFLIFVAMAASINLFHTPDTVIGSLPRVVAGFSGCFVVIRFVLKNAQKWRLQGVLSRLGTLTLELYWAHIYFVTHLYVIPQTVVTPYGIITVLVDTTAVLCLSLLLIKAIKTSPALSFLLFGNRQKQLRE